MPDQNIAGSMFTNISTAICWIVFAIVFITLVPPIAYAVFKSGRGKDEQEPWWTTFVLIAYIEGSAVFGWIINWVVIYIFRWIPILGWAVCLGSWLLMIAAEAMILATPLFLLSGLLGLACRLARRPPATLTPRHSPDADAITKHWKSGIILNEAAENLFQARGTMDKAQLVPQLRNLETELSEWAQFWRPYIHDSFFHKHLKCWAGTPDIIAMFAEHEDMAQLKEQTDCFVICYRMSWEEITEKLMSGLPFLKTQNDIYQLTESTTVS